MVRDREADLNQFKKNNPMKEKKPFHGQLKDII